MALVETKLSVDLPDADLGIPIGFSVFRKDRFQGAGGICFILRNDLSFSLVDLNSRLHCEIMGIDLLLKGKTIRLVLVYRPPNRDDLCTSLLNDLDLMCPRFVSCVVVGDFNFPKVSWEPFSCSVKIHRDFVTRMHSWGFRQYIDLPTRFNPPHILDLLWLRNRNLLLNFSINENIHTSDHASIHFALAGCLPNVPCKSFRNFKKMDKHKISGFIFNNDWSAGFWDHFHRVSLGADNPLVSFVDYFGKSLSFIIDEAVPLTEHSTLTGYPQYIRAIERRRISAFKQWTRDFDFLQKFEYDRLTYVFKSALSDHLKTRELSLIKTASNKSFFAYVNSKLKTRFIFPTLTDSLGNVAVSDLEKANLFNNHFASVCQADNGGVPGFAHFDYGGVNLTDVVFSHDKIFNILAGFASTMVSGPDNIPMIFMKMLAFELVNPLFVLFDFSLRSGSVPQAWRDANVTVLYKNKGSRADPNSYRDISITSTIVKPLEILVNEALINHCNSIGLFGPEQHAFLKRRSTTTNLILAYHDWVNTLDNRGNLDIIYLDLKKAFNSVSHNKLLLKLQHIGISGNLLSWFRSFLYGRRQRVKINDVFSGWKTVISGVPQGSVLGPSLFIIYISDLVSCASNSKISIYADDTKLYIGYKKGVNGAQELQSDLNGVAVWIADRQLELSLPKCSVLHCGSANPRPFYYLFDAELEKVESMKDLGVLMTSNLKFSTHINCICRKAYFIVNSILHNFKIIDFKFRTRLFIMYARPCLEYCSSIWNPGFVTDILTLEAVQRFFSRALLGEDIPYGQRLRTLGIEPLFVRRLKIDLCMTYKILNRLTIVDPEYIFDRNMGITRGHVFKLKKPRFHCLIKKYAFSVRIVDCWNSLPADLVTATTLRKFKMCLDKFHEDTSHLLRFCGLNNEQLERLLNTGDIFD